MNKSWLTRQITSGELQNLLNDCQTEQDVIHILYEKDQSESKSNGEKVDDQYSMAGTGLQVSAEYLQSIRSEMIEGDQLWTFKSPKKSWECLAGRGGFCILRDGEIIETYLLIMS